MNDSTDTQHPSARVSVAVVGDSVGARLQALRQKYGLSQRELARRADVTNSTLSMIEQGKVSPSVGSLEKILQAFPISLQQFFSDSLESSPVVPKDDIPLLCEGDVRRRVLSIVLDGKLLALAEHHYPSGARINAEKLAHRGYVVGMVSAGALDLYLDGVKYRLECGDGFQFSLTREHRFINAGDGTCRIVTAALHS